MESVSVVCCVLALAAFAVAARSNSSADEVIGAVIADRRCEGAICVKSRPGLAQRGGETQECEVVRGDAAEPTLLPFQRQGIDAENERQQWM